MNLRGTHTEDNLKKAMQREALVYIKYQIYASLLGNITEELKDNVNLMAHIEKEHYKNLAQILFDDRNYNEHDILNFICNEGRGSEAMYTEFARVAKEEGFDDAAEMFNQIFETEHYYLSLLRDSYVFNDHFTESKKL